MTEYDLHIELQELEELFYTQSHRSSTVLGAVINDNMYYPDFIENNKPIGIYFNFAQNIYYFTFGCQNSPGSRAYPYRGKDGILEDSYPETWYTTNQLTAYTFIIEVLSARSFEVYRPCILGFPTEVPFSVYYFEMDVGTEESDPNLRITKKLRITYVEDNIWYTDEDLDIVSTGPTNLPMLGFFKHPVDSFLDPTEIPVTDEELSVEIPGVQWSLRPDCFHSLKPLKAWVYADVYGWSWGYPIPYPEYTFDWRRTINEEGDGIQYGYDTPRALEKHRLAFNRVNNYWKHNGLSMFPTALQTAAANQIQLCFINLVGHWYFQMYDEVNERRRYAIYRKVWS